MESGHEIELIKKAINHDQSAYNSLFDKYWNNIDKWWLSQKTQNSITQFNKDYNNKTNIFSLIKLKKIINKNI